ncbi:angiotonin transactivated protein 1 isoform 2, putative [Acanthamoeba castellanii str. Neff]|uniref:Angiotonin transactivated protein 1 isoform 2, putative n=1 Tax=Acanthamoeba castellanii (strain ATCC 30010 / Neff) TaxID=1257118 RepID=L8GNW0_ACACF|nr:angiotonin transactivated protein 1 isoform 2, putative [Acanthamoeba castellanii str. Neff]ELR14779.1 angiotonin transactivated protein 1 isoform 2, putative [Acanthamoeba castellanii str. Neff]
MYRELSTILNWPEPHFPTGKFILIRDSLEADGAVLLPHFVFGYLKANKRALLVGLEQSFFHYSGVGRKLACNLKAAQTKQQFMYINALSTPYDWSAPSTSSAPAVAATPGLDSWSLGENEDAAFKSLYHKVKAFVESSEAMDEVCIVIDNLSVLLETCQRPALVLDLVHYLQAFIRRTENRASLVVLVHGDVEDDQKLVKALEHRADIIMSASGLPSGYSKEVNGQLLVHGNGVPQSKLLHFKSHDNTVRFMSK